MNETIKTKTDLKWSSFPVLFFIGSVILLLAVYGKVYLHIRLYDISTSLLKLVTIDLWFAGRNTVQQGIAKFNGQPLPIVTTGIYLSMFTSFLFLFVINPLLFIFSKKNVDAKKEEQKKPSLIVRIGFFISLAILIFIPANTISASFVLNSIFDKVKQTNAEQRYRSDVQQELSKLIYAAQQYFILPVEEGGGGKSFLKNGKLLSLRDLEFKERTPLGRIILYQQKSDTVLHIHFFGNRIGTINTSFNPEIKHVVEYEATVSPSNHKISMNY